MAEIQPFHGVLYNTQRVKPDDVLTQPYDKITPEMRERYLKLSPYNLVRIELGKEEAGDSKTINKYSRARDLYQAWLRDGILRRSAKPALYYLEQTFAAPHAQARAAVPPKQRRTRKALIARVRLHRWDEGIIMPHEHTLSKPKADRIALLRACGSQQGQIFMLYPATGVPLNELVGRSGGRDAAPTIEATDDYGVANKLWEITDPATIEAIRNTLSAVKFYIADGHHRYETALAFRDECRAHSAAHKPNPAAPYEFVMATLVDMSDPGLVILPTHRAVANLTAFTGKQFREQLTINFAVEPQPTLEKLLAAMNEERGSRPVAAAGTAGTSTTPVRLGMRDAAGFALVQPRNLDALTPLFTNKPPLWHTLDVAMLHVGVLEALLGVDEVRLREEANVTYWREPEKAAALVQTGQAQLAFFLNPTRVEDVKAIADAHSRMPQKSTDFYPKLLSGIVINDVGWDSAG
ncbi:MAG TPA: DUF1015 domain-containing protein [Verrucomicrobiae bacterium]|nr:DUF1015 domain-containing protein [Verrucomicrobiae bacterium]